MRRFGPWLLLVSACGLACLRWIVQRQAPEFRLQSSIDSYFFASTSIVRPGFPSTQRPVYPYSIIPGGIESPNELRDAVARDPVIAEHFRDFNLSALRMVTLASSRMAYVSYRVRNDIFWTRKQLPLRAGEKVITDGMRSARARCGNRISVLPQVKTLPSEPSVSELEAPLPPALNSALNQVLPSQAELLPPSFEGPGFVTRGGVGRVPASAFLFPPIPGTPVFPPPCVRPRAKDGFAEDACVPPCIPTKNHPCTHPSPVPEPGTWVLLAPGLGFVLYLRKLFG